MAAIVRGEVGLRIKCRISHYLLAQSPVYPRPFTVADTAINIVPTLSQKADIVRNTIDLAYTVDVERPRVTTLTVVETVDPRMSVALNAAALCKMADRGQIEGGVLDGPLTFDNAVSAAVAHIKGLVSEVAGQVGVSVTPDLGSGNILAEQLEHLGGVAGAGIVFGAHVPAVLISHANPHESHIVSCTLVTLLAHRHHSLPP